jgi:hypothetical protein
MLLFSPCGGCRVRFSSQEIQILQRLLRRTRKSAAEQVKFGAHNSDQLAKRSNFGARFRKHSSGVRSDDCVTFRPDWSDRSNNGLTAQTSRSGYSRVSTGWTGITFRPGRACLAARRLCVEPSVCAFRFARGSVRNDFDFFKSAHVRKLVNGL